MNIVVAAMPYARCREVLLVICVPSITNSDSKLIAMLHEANELHDAKAISAKAMPSTYGTTTRNKGYRCIESPTVTSSVIGVG